MLTAGLSMVPYLLAATPAFAKWPPTDPFRGKTLCGIIGTVVNILLGLAVAVAVIFLIIGGYQYMTSGGDKMAVSDARGKITSSIVGLIIALAAYFLIKLLLGKILQITIPGCRI